MTNIVNSCSETCQLGILDNNEVLYIGKVDSPEPIRLISYVGKKYLLIVQVLEKLFYVILTRKN
ncbi:hypothetical protein Q0Y04_20785 [Clostridioides difficile]|nr:hypothetical protein Q0Y04_20785 [Clostridioides difficile]